MKFSRSAFLAASLCCAVFPSFGLGQESPDGSLPPGVRAVWDLSKAYREMTPTRERVCLNGLWRWQPATGRNDAVPAGQWGYFKVPGSWPGITDYMQKDCQTVHAHPAWKDARLGAISAAWYQRQITIPADWRGRRITLQADSLNSLATVYVDGNTAGELRFPAGELDLTSVCRSGSTHLLSLRVAALPLKGVLLSFRDTATASEIKGSVARRGLCGDVFLVATPPGARVADVRVTTSVRQWEMTIDAGLQNFASDVRYTLRAAITQGGQRVTEFSSKPFQADQLANGRVAFTSKWKPERLWDLHTPGRPYRLKLDLLGPDGKVLDSAWPEDFGFREFWIEGRDFYLNGQRLFLSCVPLDNAQVGAAWASYAGARESLERLKSFGINFVYTHNYGCEPGSHLSFAEILRAADDVGMLVSLSQPHFSHYDWKTPDADQNNGYAAQAAHYARVAGNHPSVVFYSMSHNATGYNEDMNPDLIDGKRDVRDTWAMNNVKLAQRAEAIVRRLDPSRIVYHHASGNLGPLHAINFYPNFVPVQELSDWFEHWATEGVKPVFLCEYGAPFTWDWTMYRGWYQGKREFGSAKVPWEFCLAEWNAQFLGDRAFAISAAEKANLRWEAKQFRAGNVWHRWDYPHQVGSTVFDERYPVFASYLADNWRAFRTWGVSVNSPWEHGHFWKLREGMNRNAREQLAVDWENLQRPGFSADYLGERYERMDLAYELTDWVATPAAQALLRNNRPLLAYLAGKPAAFTSKDHLFVAGETVEKQIVVINNSRESVSCRCEWSLSLPGALRGEKAITVGVGEQVRIPLRFSLPATLPSGQYELSASMVLNNGEVQRDSFGIHVLPRIAEDFEGAKLALFDPKGETKALLSGLGVHCQDVEAIGDLSAFDCLIVGKAALTLDGPAPNITRVRDGLKVLLFEQTAEALEKRFGFRVAEYGLRQVFPRVADHPALSGLNAEHLRDWRGSATILPPRLKYELSRQFNGAPTVRWCGLEVPRLWRCGNRGNVASVLIEKPARGNLLPIVDGGFSLQYSPLLEYREGRGVVLFCQMDVTGRTESDPAAETLTRNVLQYVSAWKPGTLREVVYAGDPAGRRHLESAGFATVPYDGGNLLSNQVLVIGSPGTQKLTVNAAAITDWLKSGGRLVAVGLDEPVINALLPFKVPMKKSEHIAAFFEPPKNHAPFAGIGPADVHNRDPRELPLITAGASIVGDGVLATAQSGNVVFCQLAPWQFEPRQQINLKRTHRRVSFLLTRLLANAGVPSSTPLLARFSAPVNSTKPEKRWLDGLYLDQPEEWDDPYRFFRW